MGPVTYQWNKNNTPIAGATSQSYVIASYDPVLHEGTYTVTITGRFGSLTTNVQPPPNADPITDFYASSGIPQNLRTDNGDFDNDGIPNLIEFAYNSNPASSNNGFILNPANNLLSGGNINAILPSAGLDPTKSYFTTTIRLPKNTRGITITPQATLDLANYNDGSATINPYGDPVDDGDYILQTYYTTPDRSAAPRAFWRLAATR